MSMKRTSLETSPDDKENEIDPILQHDDDCKRVKLTSPSATKLEDLPLELIHRILVRAITMEVLEMHLAKSVWKEKADLVMSRLKTVCPYWCDILTTDFFQNELHSTLFCTVEKTTRLEKVHRFPVHYFKVYNVKVHDAVTLNDELFVLCENGPLDFYVVVFDRNNLTGMRNFIDLRGLGLQGMAACSVSNCLYVFKIPTGDGVMVSSITKKDEYTFISSPLIRGAWKPNGLAIAPNGNIILYNRLQHKEQEAKVVLYDANGVLQRIMKLPTGMKWIQEIVPMPSGNLLILSAKDGIGFSTKLAEMDMKGTVLRQYECSLGTPLKVCLVGQSGQVLIFKCINKFLLLDKEFNLLNAVGPQLEEDQYQHCTSLHYSGDRNELVTILADDTSDPVLTVFQFTEN